MAIVQRSEVGPAAVYRVFALVVYRLTVIQHAKTTFMGRNLGATLLCTLDGSFRTHEASTKRLRTCVAQ